MGRYAPDSTVWKRNRLTVTSHGCPLFDSSTKYIATQTWNPNLPFFTTIKYLQTENFLKMLKISFRTFPSFLLALAFNNVFMIKFQFIATVSLNEYVFCWSCFITTKLPVKRKLTEGVRIGARKWC